MTLEEARAALQEAAADARVALLPWQVEYGSRWLAGEAVYMTIGKRGGLSTLRRIVTKAQEADRTKEGTP